MAYQIDLSQLKFIIDDTPLLKRYPKELNVKTESTEYFDANSTICECNEELEPYMFLFRFKVELKQDPIIQSNEDKELYNMGSSFGVNQVDNNNNNNNNFNNQNDKFNNNMFDQNNDNQVKQSFNNIKKCNVSVQTNKLFLKNQQQLFKYNQKYRNHKVYQETLNNLKQNQRFQKFVSKKNNKIRSIYLFLLLILFIILIMCL